jgi:hypothetical protein
MTNHLSRRGIIAGLGAAVGGTAFAAPADTMAKPYGRLLTPEAVIHQFLMAGDLGLAELQHATLDAPSVSFAVSRPDRTVRHAGAGSVVSAWASARMGRNFSHMVSTTVVQPRGDVISLRCYATEHCYGASGQHRLGESHYLFDCVLGPTANDGLALRTIVSQQLSASGIGMDWFGGESPM